MKATRSQSTELAYKNRGILLCIKAYVEATEAKVKTQGFTQLIRYKGEEKRGLTAVATAKWAKAHWFSSCSSSTWRQYRSSLLFYAETQLLEGILPDQSSIDKIADILDGSPEKKLKARKTSANKMKHITNEDLSKLLKELSKSRSKMSGFLSVWLYVNCLVGLRPFEWQNSEIVMRNNSKHLKVYNAKQTNGRSHGEFRYINISHLSENQQDKITTFTEACIEMKRTEAFNSSYENCRKLLQRTCKRIWPKRKRQITLYSTRHQFSADMKFNGKKLDEIAYLMGHFSTDTATSHYGKRRYGKSKVTPDVPKSDLGGVSPKYKKFTFNRSLKR
ncbi:conserved hypothetical protein [Vibrio chagasii]|nr:conserved hypothetical protein [Vibrio chagasii]